MGIIVNGTKFSSGNKYVVKQEYTDKDVYLNPLTLNSGDTSSDVFEYVLINTNNDKLIFKIYLNNYKLSSTFFTIYYLKDFIYDNVKLFSFEDLKIRYRYNSQNIILEKSINELNSGLNIDFSFDTENESHLVITLNFTNSNPFGDTTIQFNSLVGKLKYNNDYLILYYPENSINNYQTRIGGLISHTAVNSTIGTVANNISLTKYSSSSDYTKIKEFTLNSKDFIPDFPIGKPIRQITGNDTGHVLAIYVYKVHLANTTYPGSMQAQYISMTQKYSEEVTISYD